MSRCVATTSNTVGKKRPRRNLQHSQACTTPILSDSSHEASDEADASSDSTEEPYLQKQQGLSNKHQKLMAHPKGQASSKPPPKGKANARRILTTPINWSDCWWETQKTPEALAEAINCCKETKSTRSHTDPCPALLHILYLGVCWIHELKSLYCTDHSRLVPGDDFCNHFGGRLHQGATSGTTRYIFLTTVAFHLADCYPDIRNQSYEQLKSSLPTQLL
jgi:hypothetical protein